MLVNDTIPNLINGISQQPATLRLPSQAEEQVNFLSTVAEGLKRRPPTRHVAKLSDVPWDDAFIHSINRDTTERYTMFVRDGQLRVFTLGGVEKTVNAPNGWGYLSGAAKADYRAVTVADYTFLLNRKVQAEMTADLSPKRPNRTMVVVRGSNYARDMYISINGTIRTWLRTPRGSDDAHQNEIQLNVIAKTLYERFTNPSYQPGEGSLGNPSGRIQGTAAEFADFHYSVEGNIVQIWRNDDVPFSITVEDGSGGANMVAVEAQMQRFSDLPEKAPDGFSAEIVGDNNSSFDNYFVKFQATGGNVWKETLKGNEKFRLNGATMPHILVRESDGSFTFKQAVWEDRKVGDLDKIPEPSFIGRGIRDIFFHRNRLGLAADENIILTEAGEFFNFFRTTATATLDNDPIDVATTNARVSIINYAVPFNESLLLFSDQTQFVLEGGDLLTPQTVSVSETTNFENSAKVRPVGVGQFVYFVTPRGSYSGVREYFVVPDSTQKDALDVTSHCPRYLPDGLTRLEASSAEDILLALSDRAPNSMWVYKFFFGNEGKLQSSWSRWEFAPQDRILNVAAIESSVFMLVARPDGTYIERLDLEAGAVDDDSRILYRFDRGVYETQMGVSFDGTDTTLTLPYTPTQSLWVIVRAGDAAQTEGRVLSFTQPTANTVLLRGDWRGVKIAAGERYSSTYTFSTLMPRKGSEGGGTSGQTSGRVQVRSVSLNYTQTGFFKVTVEQTGRGKGEKIFSGRTVGTDSSRPGVLPLVEGSFRVPVLTRNTEATISIESDSFMPCIFTSAEWEGFYTFRSRSL